MISAKTGLGVDEVLEAIVHRLPPPKGDGEAPLKALLVDSWYDAYLGVVVLVRIVDGLLKKGQAIRMMRTDARHEVDRVGMFTPKMVDHRRARAGRDRLPHRLDQGGGGHARRRHHHRRPPPRPRTPLPGFRPAQPVVFCGLFPVDAADFENLRAADRQAPAERRELLLRDGDLRGARLRLPLRLSGASAPGDHPGAAGRASSTST